MSVPEYIKCVLTGDGAVGKTCLLLVYIKGTFPKDYVPTVMDNYGANLMVKNQKVTLDIWDTAGQEDFASIRSLSYPNSNVFIVCYSCVSRGSFLNIKDVWLQEIQGVCPDVPWVLCGTKEDLMDATNPQHISAEEAESFGKAMGAFSSVQCSAMYSTNVSKVFQEAIKSLTKGSGGGGGCCTLM